MNLKILKQKSFSELSNEEIQWLKDNNIINGCGGKGGWIKPPNLKFKASCDHHDWNYEKGGDESDRYDADHSFYLAMLQDAHLSNHYWFYRTWAYLYFRAVRLYGYKFFEYR